MCLLKVLPCNTERGGRMIFETIQSIRTIAIILRKWLLDIPLWFYNQCRAQAVTPGLFGNYIRSRRMFFLRIIARATTLFPPPVLSIISYAFIFSLIAPSFRSTASFLPTPLIFQSGSVGVPLKARLSGKYHTSLPLYL